MSENTTIKMAPKPDETNEVAEKNKEFIIPMANDPNENLTDQEKEFLDELDEKYGDRNDYKDTPIIAEVSDVMINEKTDGIITNDPGSLSSVKIDENGSDVVKTIMEQGTKEITELPSEDKLSKELKDVYDMDDKDVLNMIQILQRMQKGEKFSVYSSLPDKIKNMVGMSMAANNIPMTMENRNIVARALIDDILNDIKNDDSFIEFNQALQEIAEIPSIIDFHAENYREIMEEKLIDIAEKCKDTKPEVSSSLYAISAAWKDTYTFARQHAFLDNSESARNSVTKDIDDKYHKMTRDFNFKAEKSKYILNDIHIMVRVLNKYFKNEYSESIHKAFVCLFINTCSNLDFNKPEDIAFIYYTIKNIIALEFVNKDKLLEFNEELVANIRKLLDRIVELDRAYQERLKNTNNKRTKRKMERRKNKKGGK